MRLTPNVSAWRHIGPALALSITLVHLGYAIYHLRQEIDSQWIALVYFFGVLIMALYLAVSWRVDE